MEKSVKPQVLSTFGDVALAIGPAFVRYGNIVLDYLHKATLVQLKDKVSLRRAAPRRAEENWRAQWSVF